MKRFQNNLLTTAHTVSAMLETLTATSAPPAILAARTALDNLIGEINALANQQANPLPPRTLERNMLFDAASDAAHVVARLVRGYALQQGMMALAGEVDFAPSDLGRGRFAHRLQRMLQVQAAAQANAAALATAGVPAATLADLDAKIATATAVIAAPRSNIAARRLATENLFHPFRKLVQHLDYTLDPLMETYRQTDPDAYTLYRTARRVINRPGTPAEDPESAPQAVQTSTASHATAAQPLAA